MGHCSKNPLPPVENTIFGGKNTIGNPAYHNKWYLKSNPKILNCFGKSLKNNLYIGNPEKIKE